MNKIQENFANKDYIFKLDNYIYRGWNIFCQYFWGFVAYSIVSGAILISFYYLIFIVLELNEKNAGLIIFLIIIYLGIYNALITGFYIIGLKIVKQKSIRFKNFFDGFKSFLPIVLLTLISGILLLFGTFFFVIPSIYLWVSYFFALLFLIEYRLNFWSALEISRNLVNRNWFSFFGFGLVLGVINIVGLNLFSIGFFFTFPFTICATVAAFEDIVGLRGEKPQVIDSKYKLEKAEKL